MRVAETDYFERKHLERKQLGRLEASQKAARLTKYDGSSWQNRVTEPRALALFGTRVGLTVASIPGMKGH